MTMNNNETQCGTYEPLISAMIDGELEPNEFGDLELHLETCASCRAQLDLYGQVDNAVGRLSAKSFAGVPDSHSNNSPLVTEAQEHGNQQTDVFVVSRNKSTLADWLSPWRLIPIGAAAALLIGLAITMFPTPSPVTANEFSAQQYVEPMKELHMINVMQQRDQDLMLRTLGMDLRTLKLELNQLEPGSTEQQNLAAQIDAMLEKVHRFETSTPSESLDANLEPSSF